MALPLSPGPLDQFDHEGPWTEPDYLALPEDRRRVELLDGGLLMSPSPGGRHQRLSFQLCHALARVVPASLEALEAINVRVAPGKILIPDLAVVTNPGADLTVWRPDDVALVVELVSPGSAAADRAVKPPLYAHAGIAHYLRIELAAPTPLAVVYGLDDGRYVERGRSAPDGRLRLADPVRLDVDLAALATATRLAD